VGALTGIIPSIASGTSLSAGPKPRDFVRLCNVVLLTSAAHKKSGYAAKTKSPKMACFLRM
jgi:hypothetical protein